MTRRDLIRGAAALPLAALAIPRTARALPIGPTTPIDTNVLYALHGIYCQQQANVQGGHFDYNLGRQFFDLYTPAMLGVGDDTYIKAISAINSLSSDADVAITPERSAMVAEAYSMWGLTAPDGFAIAPEASNPSLANIKAFCTYPNAFRQVFNFLDDSFRQMAVYYPVGSLMRATPDGMSRSGYPFEYDYDPEPTSPTSSPDYPIPTNPSRPRQEESTPYSPIPAPSALDIWNAVINSGKITAGIGGALCGVAVGGSFINLLGEGAATVLLGFGVGMMLGGMIIVGIGMYQIFKLGFSRGGSLIMPAPALVFG